MQRKDDLELDAILNQPFSEMFPAPKAPTDEVMCGCLLLRSPGEKVGPIKIDIQKDVFDEIYIQVFDYLQAAYRNREDRWKAVRIIIQAERLVAEYVDFGFYLLNPLAEVLHRLFRAERRVFIRRALLCREEDRPIYKEALKRWDGVDASDDFRAVERALYEGASMFDDLRRWAG
jgi:hypothetical protein